MSLRNDESIVGELLGLLWVVVHTIGMEKQGS